MNKKTSFSCGTALDIANVHTLKERLEAAVSKSIFIELKADRVEKADTAGIQLIVSLIKLVEKNSGAIYWKAPSSILVETARRLGLSERIGL